MDLISSDYKDYNIEDILDIKLSDDGIEVLVTYSEEEKCPDEWLHISALNEDMKNCMYNFYNKVSIIKYLLTCRLQNYHPHFVVCALLHQNLFAPARNVVTLFVRFAAGVHVATLVDITLVGVH